jgi:hypothetical protein
LGTARRESGSERKGASVRNIKKALLAGVLSICMLETSVGPAEAATKVLKKGHGSRGIYLSRNLWDYGRVGFQMKTKRSDATIRITCSVFFYEKTYHDVVSPNYWWTRWVAVPSDEICQYAIWGEHHVRSGVKIVVKT